MTKNDPVISTGASATPDRGAAVFRDLAAAGGRPLSPYLSGLLEMILASPAPPQDLPIMNGKQMAAHWRRISRLATELVEAVEGPKGRRLAATYTLRGMLALRPKNETDKPLEYDISESPSWWRAVRELLASIAEISASEASRQQQESAQRGRGVSAATDVNDELFAMIYAFAGAEAWERGERPPDDYQNFRRALAKHLPSHLLSNVTPEAFAQRPKRQEKRLRRRRG